jgi:hypothetical protein
MLRLELLYAEGVGQVRLNLPKSCKHDLTPPVPWQFILLEENREILRASYNCESKIRHREIPLQW